MGAQFITGTGTDIGKTWLACALLRHWRAGPAPRGAQAGALRLRSRAPRPAMPGRCWRRWAGRSMRARWTPSRPGVCGAAVAGHGGGAEGRQVISTPWWRLPAAPRKGRLARCWSRASAASWCRWTRPYGARLDRRQRPALRAGHRQLPGQHEPYADGAGGLAHAGVPVAAIAVNETEGSAVALGLTLASLLRHVGGIPLVGIRRADPGPGIARLAGLLAGSFTAGSLGRILRPLAFLPSGSTMSIKSDKWIRRMAEQHKMIEPFEAGQVREANGHKIVSYGTSSYGYDIRCSREFKLFTNINSTIVDPKNFDPNSFVEVNADFCIIPPNSFALARTVEYFRIPRNVLTICLGKSTYARCGIIVNVTPFEPEWEGYVTLEFSNTTPLPAKIYAGEGCAQVLFFESDEVCETSYKDRGGKYQGQVGVTLPKI
jgi:dCTP deaminase